MNKGRTGTWQYGQLFLPRTLVAVGLGGFSQTVKIHTLGVHSWGTLLYFVYLLMEPKPELAAGGPCLAIPGQVYAYLVQPSSRPSRSNLGQAREIAVNLNALQGPATAQWVNIWSGEKTDSQIPGPGIYQFNRPESFGAAPGLLIVHAQR